MASVSTDIIERILAELDADTNSWDDGVMRNNELLRQPIPFTTDPDTNNPYYINFEFPGYGININGTKFNFLREFRMVFDKLFYYSKSALEWPFNTHRILKGSFSYKVRFVEYKCSQHPLELITSTQRIVAYIFSIMPVNLKQNISRRILTKDLGQRRHAGPVTCSAQRPRRTGPSQDITTSDFLEYFYESPESIGNSSESYELEFARRRTSPEELHLYSRIINFERRVLSHLENVKQLSDFILKQYESGNGLDFRKIHNLMLCYFLIVEMRKYQRIEEETFEELALIVANNCKKYMLCTFKILELRHKLDFFAKSGSYIQNAIFLLNIHRKMDTEVKNISMNIRRLVRVARNYLFWTK